MPEENDIEILRARAQALFDVGRYKEALPLLHRALAIDPEDGELLCMLSFTCVHLEEYKDAMEWADKAVAVDPEEEWGHRLRSVILMRLGKIKPALDAALVAVELDPDGLYPLSNLVEAFVLNSKLEDADKIAQRMLSVSPEEGLTHRTCAYVSLYQHRFAEAEQSCRLALELEPENARSLRLLGDALSRQDRLREAMDSYAESLKRNPTNADTRKALANAAMRYLGRPWGPYLVGVIALLAMLVMSLSHFRAILVSGWLVRGYAWITVRHGLHEVWSANPRFTELPENTRYMIVEACRTQTSDYLDEVFLIYYLFIIGVYILFAILYALFHH